MSVVCLGAPLYRLHMKSELVQLFLEDGSLFIQMHLYNSVGCLVFAIYLSEFVFVFVLVQ